MFPTEVEADFAHHYPRDDLRAWHRGDLDKHGCYVLSSRRLLALLTHLPPTSAYKISQRGGYLSELELVAYETYNEVARLRASYYAIKGGEENVYEPHQFIDPVKRIEDALAGEIVTEETLDASENLYGDMGL